MVKDVRKLERLLRTLGNRRRLFILEIINHRGSMAVGEVAAALKVSYQVTSQHLRLMETLGIVRREKKANFIYYSIGDEKIVKTILKLH